MSVGELFEYFQWTNSTSCVLPNFFGGFMSGGGVEVGIDGQKGVCLDKKVLPDPRNCLVYSFGINNDWSFDDTVALYGCQVFSFDPTISKTNHTRETFKSHDDVKPHNYSIEFYEMGLDDHNYEGFGKKPHVPMRTLKTLYNFLKQKHGERVIDYLKIDIDDSEWRVIPNIIKSGMLDKVRQLALEIHLKPNDTIDEIRKRAKIVRSLEEHGMVRFTSLLNQFSYEHFTALGPVFRGPTAFEIAYYNSRLVRDKDIE